MFYRVGGGPETQSLARSRLRIVSLQGKTAMKQPLRARSAFTLEKKQSAVAAV